MDRHIVTRFFGCLLFVGLLWCGGLFAQPIDCEMYANVVRSNSKLNCPFFEEGVRIEKLSYTPGRLHFHITTNEENLMGLSILNQLCTDTLILDFPPTLLKEWRSQAKKLTLANDSQMREYMESVAEEMMESFEEALDSASNLKIESAEYNDGIF